MRFIDTTSRLISIAQGNNKLGIEFLNNLFNRGGGAVAKPATADAWREMCWHLATLIYMSKTTMG